MTLTAKKFADAINRDADDPKPIASIPAWIAKKLGDPALHLYKSKQAAGSLRYAKRKAGKGRTGGKRGRMKKEDQERLLATKKEFYDTRTIADIKVDDIIKSV